MNFRILERIFPGKRIFYNFSIKYRLLFYFLFLVFLPTSIISTTVYYKSRSIITERVNNTTHASLKMSATIFEQRLDAVNDVMQLIYLSSELQSILSSSYFTTQSQTILSPRYSFRRNKLMSEIASLDKILEGYSESNVANTTIFPELYIYNRPEYLFYSSSEKVTDLSVIQNEDWYRRIPPASRYSVIGLNKIATQSGMKVTLKMAKRLFGLNHTQIPYAGLLTVDADIESFNSLLDSYKPSPGSTVVVINRENQILSSSDTHSLGAYFSKDICNAGSLLKMDQDPKPFLLSVKNGGQFIISSVRMGTPGFIITSMSPVDEMYGELVSFNIVMIIVLMVCLVLCFIVAMFLSDNIAYPIRKLVKSMSIVKDGNFDVPLHYKRNDEFAFLISAYNKMVKQIKDLIDSLYISELNKRNAELKSLQSQINPHFLYNTLDSVNWLALKHNVPDISKMVTSLSDFFRYSLSKGRNIIPLGDEKKQVESYLEIQATRFREKIHYRIEFADDILECLTVKLIMQPIVENAIIHGIEKRRGKGTIVISAAKKEDDIEIRISDDGIGTDIHELNALLEDHETSRSYGIRNVHERIKQTFGSRYGIRFCSNEPSGVTAILTIPAATKWEENHVENDHSR
jgi:two-component system, sensor histidine kinase YesM